MDTSPPNEQEFHSPEYWRKRLKLPATQKVPPSLVAQLERCKDDEARRIIMNARMEGHEWKSKSARREH